MWRWIIKTMGQGFFALIPVSLTIGLALFLGYWVESLLANPLKGLFPGSSEAYRMGMGILSFFLLMFLFGLLMKLWLVRKLLAWIEGWLMQIPLVKTILGAVKDVVKFIGGGSEKKGGQVVMVTLDNGWRQVGIVTRRDFSDLPASLAASGGDLVAVYFPFGYQLGGFTYFIDKSRCDPIPEMTVEDAMRYSMMAWMGAGEAEKA